MTGTIPASAAASGATPSSAPQSARDGLNADYESFLRLLTAQISNQDPLEPMDSSKFVTQLAQLSNVEQGVQTNETLGEISRQLGRTGRLGDVQLMDRTVMARGETFRAGPDPVRLGYALDGPAASGRMVIRDGDGAIVDTVDLDALGAGHHGLDWTPPPGARGALHAASLEAVSADGEAVGGATFAPARVTAVELEPQGTRLRLDTGAEIAAEEVREIVG